MPFTPSHAIVALPFARTPLPAGAVAIGAMTPDLPLFFPWATSYEQTHGFPSLLWVSLPLAVALYVVWRLVLRPAASGLVPHALAVRLPRAWDRPEWPDRPVRAAALVVAAALIGVVSHVVWDLFTHPGRLGSEWIPVLAQPWGPLDGTAWLQHGSSALGLAGIAVWAVFELRRPRLLAPRDDSRAVAAVRVVAWISAALVVLLSVGAQVAADGLPGGSRELADTAFHAGTRAGALILVLALVASGAVQLARRLRP